MFPLGDYNQRPRTPVVTYALIAFIGAAWLLVQGAGLDARILAESVCKLGLIPAALTRSLASDRVSLGEGITCVVTDRGPLELVTLLTSMFLHGGWLHIIGNAWFLRIFGDDVEESMGRTRFLAFYLICGLIASLAQVAVEPASGVPIVGASGAISGVMGAYLVLYPNTRVKTLFTLFIFIRVVAVPAWVMLLYWFAMQLLSALPQLAGTETAATSGVAVVAHVAGFLMGVLLAKPFATANGGLRVDGAGA